jgi:RNA polymerase sigma factor (TIGR02999 family)
MTYSMADVTQLLHRWLQDRPEAESQLFEFGVPDLRRLAQYLTRGERQFHSLQPTELVDQMDIHLVAAKSRDWRNLRHFFAITAGAMRRHLIGHARVRPDAQFVAIKEWESFLLADSANVDLAVTVDRLLDELAETKSDWCNLFGLKYFLDEEAADVLGVNLRSVQRMWRDCTPLVV